MLMHPRNWAKAALLLAIICAGAQAQTWPAKPVHILVANAPGAVTDVLARVYADQLARGLAQPAIIDNRPGGDGLIAAQAAARSTPDGYTLFVASQSFVAVDPNTHASLPVDPARDFTPVAVLIDTTPIAIAVPAGLPVKNIGELVAMAKKQPGKLSYGVTVPILSMVGKWLNQRAGIDMVEVFYKSTGQQLGDTVAGVIPVSISTVGSFAPLVKAGKVRVIAVTSPQRVPGWDEVPSLMETYPDMDVGGGLVLLAPAGTRTDIVDRLNRESQSIVRSPEFTQRAREFAWANLKGARTPAEVAEYMRIERAHWAQVVRAIGLKPQ